MCPVCRLGDEGRRPAVGEGDLERLGEQRAFGGWNGVEVEVVAPLVDDVA